MDNDENLREQTPVNHRPDPSEQAARLLASYALLRPLVGRVEFAVEGEVLRVRGAAPSFYHKQMLQAKLKGLAGIRQIDNRVEVVRPPDDYPRRWQGPPTT
jgi:hypothetical protein